MRHIVGKRDNMDKKDTVFIIGSGPSLNKLDVSKLADYDTISLNRQYIAYSDWGFIPTYYLIIDPQLIKTIYGDVERLIRDEKDIKKFFIMKHGYNGMDSWIERMKSQNKDRVFGMTIGADEKLSIIRPFSDDRRMSFVGNAGACAVEVAMLLGYKRVVLLGIDAHYVDRNESIKANKDLSHFHPNYFDVNTFKEGRNQGPHNQDSGTKYWKMFSEQQKNIPNFEVISSSPSSPINEFLEYVEFEDLIK